MKQAFQYSTAGLFMGVTDADESPLEEGVYLVPGNCTLTPPPETWPAGKVPRFNGTTWEIVNLPNDEKPEDPLAKLQAFLNANPDVAGMLHLGELPK